MKTLLRSFAPRALGCLGLCLLLHCSHSDPSLRTTASPEPDPRAAQDPLYAHASVFHRFLRHELNSAETSTLVSNCRSEVATNPFCHSVLNFEELEEKRKRKQTSTAETKGGPSKVRPRFKQETVTNWEDIAAAPINRLLRGLGGLSPSEIKKLEKRIHAEKACPNNVAIALASHQEDLLPEQTTYSEVARLYEIGSACITSSEADRETLTTRAGLFYFADKKYDTALPLFLKASQTPNTFVGRSLYWLYRTQAQLGQTAAAEATLQSLKAKYPFAFHTLVALTTTAKDPGDILKKTASPSVRRSQNAPNLNLLIEQVEILWKYNFEAAAAHVLNWAIVESQGVEPEVVIYLAELKKEQGDYRTKISLLSEVLYKNPQLISRETLELYFPKVYFPIFEKRSSGVDPYLLLAIARRESAFNPRAVSVANARGLLQVLPQTSQRVIKRTNLFDPETNVEAGSKYITELLQKLDGQIHLALAAYNAGPNRVVSWNLRYPVTEPVLFVDLIPYRETREYVASVLRNYYWYRRLHRGEENLNSKELLQLAITK